MSSLLLKEGTSLWLLNWIFLEKKSLELRKCQELHTRQFVVYLCVWVYFPLLPCDPLPCTTPCSHPSRKTLSFKVMEKESRKKRGHEDPVVGRTAKEKMCFCILQRYTLNSGSIYGVKVVAGNVNGLTGAKEMWVVRVSVPAVCEVIVADDDTDHKMLHY